MKTVDRVKKKQRADALVKIVAAPAKCFQFRAFREQFRQPRRRGKRRRATGCASAGPREVMISMSGLACACDQRSALLVPAPAVRPVRTSTSSRSWPSRASASCAVSRPYFTPMSYRRPAVHRPDNARGAPAAPGRSSSCAVPPARPRPRPAIPSPPASTRACRKNKDNGPRASRERSSFCSASVGVGFSSTSETR